MIDYDRAYGMYPPRLKAHLTELTIKALQFVHTEDSVWARHCERNEQQENFARELNGNRS